jgi:hypothetical protein
MPAERPTRPSLVMCAPTVFSRFLGGFALASTSLVAAFHPVFAGVYHPRAADQTTAAPKSLIHYFSFLLFATRTPPGGGREGSCSDPHG